MLFFSQLKKSFNFHLNKNEPLDKSDIQIQVLEGFSCEIFAQFKFSVDFTWLFSGGLNLFGLVFFVKK